MLKYIFVILFSFLITNVDASDKEKIIDNLKNTKSLNLILSRTLTVKLRMEIVQLNILKKYFVNMQGVIIKL